MKKVIIKKTINKIIICIPLLILSFVYINAYPVAAYSYTIPEKGQLQIGWGLLSAIKPQDKLDKFAFNQPYIKYGLPYGLCIGLDFQYRADVFPFKMDEASEGSNILSVILGKSLPYENHYISNINISINYGFKLLSHQHLIAVLSGDIHQVNTALGISVYSVSPTDTVAGGFIKLSMASNNESFNVNPYIFAEYEWWNLSRTQLIIGAGFSLYLDLLNGGDK